MTKNEANPWNHKKTTLKFPKIFPRFSEKKIAIFLKNNRNFDERIQGTFKKSNNLMKKLGNL